MSQHPYTIGMLDWVDKTAIISLARWAQDRTGSCADSWTDEQCELFKAKIVSITQNVAYGFIPAESFRRLFMTLRKNGELK